MKKILVVVSLVMAAFSFQASAATTYLGTIQVFETFGGYITADNSKDTWTFNLPYQSVISASATNSYAKFAAKITGKINGFTATLNGVALDLTTIGTTQMLSIDNLLSKTGLQTLEISGTGEGSYGGSIAVAQTPIPAALWLFGSALMGLFGVSRRKSA